VVLWRALGFLSPRRERPQKIGIRSIIEQSDEFERVAIRVREIELRRAHSANDRRLSGFLAQEVLTGDAAGSQPFAGSQKLGQGQTKRGSGFEFMIRLRKANDQWTARAAASPVA
jgi:hypothetical protein